MINKIISKLLREAADKIEVGSCEMSEEEGIELIEYFSKVAMSKEKSCSYLGISRSSFDALVKSGELPKGVKRIGFKELVWYKNDLDNYIKMKKDETRRRDL